LSLPGGIEIGILLTLIVIIVGYVLIIKPYLKRRKSQIEAGKLKATLINQTNKRIIGIIITSLGGIGGLLFGLTLSNASNQLYLTRSHEEETIFTYSILTGISVIIFIIGVIIILTAKTSNKTDGLKLKDESTNIASSELGELEKLAELRDKGIITEEEFNIKKKNILGI